MPTDRLSTSTLSPATPVTCVTNCPGHDTGKRRLNRPRSSGKLSLAPSKTRNESMPGEGIRSHLPVIPASNSPGPSPPKNRSSQLTASTTTTRPSESCCAPLILENRYGSSSSICPQLVLRDGIHYPSDRGSRLGAQRRGQEHSSAVLLQEGHPAGQSGLDRLLARRRGGEAGPKYKRPDPSARGRHHPLLRLPNS